MKNMFLFVGRFVLEFNHSAPHGSQLPTTQPHSSESSKIEQKSKSKQFWTNLFHFVHLTAKKIKDNLFDQFKSSKNIFEAKNYFVEIQYSSKLCYSFRPITVSD